MSPSLHPFRRISANALLFTLVGALGLTLYCRRSEAVAGPPEEREAQKYLIEYLKFDTTNPPGNETPAAVFLQKILLSSGVNARLVGSNPGRQSVYARLTSGTNEPALLLLHHIDVVPVMQSQWSVPAFKGERAGGYIWGRGALDIKSLGIAELMAFLDLKRRGARLSRDVIFLAVADEETGGLQGTKELLEKNPELFSNVGFVINEGGSNETVVDHVAMWGIEVAQKVPLWVRVTTRGAAAHSAVPPEDGGSVVALLSAIERIRKIERPYRMTAPVAKEFASLAPHKPGEKGEILRDPVRYLNDPAKLEALAPSYRSLLHDTVAFTVLRAGVSVNSIPAEATAEIDVRLLPDERPRDFLEKITAATGPDVSVDVLLEGEPTPASPTETPLYAQLERAMKKAEPASAVCPIVSAGTSDSRFFRARNVVAYGVSPFKVNYYDADTIHGADERVRASFFDDGVRLMRSIVNGFCAAQPRTAK